MAQRKRVLRSYQPRRRQVFDDQQWPIDMALVVFGGFMIGSILVYQRFDSPYWYASPWLSITGVVLLIATTIWALRSVGNQFVRRTMQLSVVICAIFHLIMLILALENTIFSKIWQEPQAARDVKAKKPVTIAEYHPSQMEQHQKTEREFDKPVETEVPQPTPREIERPDQQQPQTPTPPQPQPVPDPVPEVKPEVVKQKAQTAAAQPRQSDQQSKLSRQQTTAVKSRNAAVTVPQVTPAARDSNPQLQANAANVARPQASRQQQRKQANNEPARTVAQQANNLQRAARQQPQPTTSRTAQPTMQRRTATAQQLPRTQVVPTQQSAVSRKTPTPTIKPANTLARQQTTAAPQRTQTPTRERTATTSQVAQQRLSRQQPAPQKPTIAQTPQPVSNRSPRLTERPSPQLQSQVATPQLPTPATRSAPQQPTAQNRAVARVTKATTATRKQVVETSNPSAAPSATRANRATRRQTDPSQNVAQNTNQVQRRQTTALAQANTAVVTPTAKSGTTAAQPAAARSLQSNTAAVTRSRAASQENSQRSATVAGPATSTPTSASSNVVRSNRAARQPSTANAATASNSIERTVRQAQVAVSPQAASVAVGSPKTAVATPANQPARSAVAKATTGVAGRGKSNNLDRALSAASNQATTASNSAARTRATQQNQSGPQLAPTAVANVQRSRAGAAQPSATLSPNTVELPNTVASSRPAQETLDAAASLNRSAAQAAENSVTAAKGNVEVDLGATQLVDQQNVGRAAGGGQPEVSSQLNAAAATQHGKSSARAMILSNQVAATAAAPAAASAGQATEIAAQPATSSVARADAANPSAALSQPVSADDPAGAAGAGAAVAQATARRAQQDTGPPTGAESGDQEAQEKTAGKHASRQLPSSLNAKQVVVAATDPTTPGDGGPAAAAPASAGAPAKFEVGKVSTGSESSLTASQPANTTDPTSGNPAQPGAASLTGPEISRAEATEGSRGQPELGGGTDQPQRVAQGRPLLAPSIATTVSAAGAPQSAGADTGVPVEAQGDPAGRLAGGVNAPARDRAAGAAAGDTVVDTPTTGTSGIAVGDRQRQSESATGPEVTTSDSPGGIVRRANVGRGLPAASSMVTVDLPEASPGGNGSSVQANTSVSGAQIGPVARRATDNLPVRVDVQDGVGGLGNNIAADAGITSRRASPDSIHVQIQPGRFLSKTSRGLPTFNTRAAVATDSFQGRKRPGDGGETGLADPKTEEAIDLGLAFLARNQLQDGRWSLSQFAQLDGQPVMSSDTAATALAVLAFQGAGYNHQQYKYQQVLRNGLQFLLSNQAENGDLYLPQGGSTNQAVWLYSHAIATLALCEAYGMTQDPDLRDQVQKAVDFIVAGQEPERGGWRYQPGRESDTSVTGWMLMALESGRRANLKVPAKTFDKIRAWMDKAADPDAKHLYRYNPYAPTTAAQGAGLKASPTMTSVGLLMRLYTGWKTSEARMINGADYLKQNLPALGVESGQSQRDTYYWYYATQVMFHMGGDHWKAWNDRLHPLLVNAQIRDGNLAGSWDFRRPVMDRWGPHAGRIYLTTMNLLSLEVHYRHLPLYEASPVSGEVAAENND